MSTLLDLAFGDAGAVAQEIGAVGGAQRMVRIVGGEQHAVAGRRERADFAHHLALVAEVEAGGRLVEHDELRLLRQRSRQQHELPLAAGDHGVGPLLQMPMPNSSSARSATSRSCADGRLNSPPCAVRPMSTTVSTVNANVGLWTCGT